jgi:hypothetical protein
VTIPKTYTVRQLKELLVKYWRKEGKMYSRLFLDWLEEKERAEEAERNRLYGEKSG